MIDSRDTFTHCPRSAICSSTDRQAMRRPGDAAVGRQAWRRHALSTVLLAAAGAAQAVPVSVSIEGLPPGLSPALTVQRNICPDGMSFIDNPTQILTEQSMTSFERVTLPSGQTIFRSRVRTRYVASFDTPVTPERPTQPFEVRCSRVSINPDLFNFGIRLIGSNARGLPAQLTGVVAQTLQGPAVKLNLTLAASTTELIVVNQPQDTLARGMVHSVNVSDEASLGSVQARTLDLLRPSTLFPGAQTRVARLFERSDGAACVQAGKQTQCLGEVVSPEAGGVILRGFRRPAAGRPGPAVFQFELQQGFPVGPLKLSASADASDLTRYLVDGQLETLDLLPWQAKSKDLIVQ
jgi:hypothetical protein